MARHTRYVVWDSGDHHEMVQMRSHYFLIKKEGGTSSLKREMIVTVFQGDMRMVRSDERHGRELDKLVQLTCDTGVEEEFLTDMWRERIQELPLSYEKMRLTMDRPARGDERKRMEADHAKLFLSQLRRAAEAGVMVSTREHLAALLKEAAREDSEIQARSIAEEVEHQSRGGQWTQQNGRRKTGARETNEK